MFPATFKPEESTKDPHKIKVRFIWSLLPGTDAAQLNMSET